MENREQEILEEITDGAVGTEYTGEEVYVPYKVSPQKLAAFLAKLEESKK